MENSQVHVDFSSTSFVTMYDTLQVI